MPNKFVFFDINRSIVETMQEKIKSDNSVFVCDDVRKIINNHNVDILVSPANSMGYMDGGIDKIYSMMFTGIQKSVMDKIKTYNISSSLPEISGQYVLPIGSAMNVEIDTNKYPTCKQLFVCPTMEYPRNITDTPEIIYYTVCGMLNLVDHYDNKTIAIPGLGTACGGLSAKIMCQQINSAFSEYNNQFLVKNKEYIIENSLSAFVVKNDLYLV